MIGGRSTVTVTFALFVVFTAVGFGLTEANHVTYLNRQTIDAEVVGYRVTQVGDERAINATVSIENPTPRPVVVVRAKGFQASLAGQTVATLGTTTVDPARIPARGTRTRTVTLSPTAEGEARWDAVRTSAEDGTLVASGVFSGRISEKYITISVTRGSPDDA